jgi:hypothetical protein
LGRFGKGRSARRQARCRTRAAAVFFRTRPPDHAGGAIL